jgi:predicted GH43/DUF377 family glycosyl hydrolase
MPSLPEAVDRLTRSNRTWYTRRLDELLPMTSFRRLDDEATRDRLGIRPGWSAFNPSIVASQWRGTADGFLTTIRSSNYRIVGGRYVIAPEDGETIRTTTYLAHLSDDLDLIDAFELPIAYRSNGFRVQGLEDLRLNQIGDTLLASATVRDLGPPDGTARMATVEIDRATRSCRAVECPESTPGRHEKNWMPITGRMGWIYSCSHDGLVWTATGTGPGVWWVTSQAESPPVAAQFRGGSQAVPVGDGRWLAIVHEVAEGGDWRVYEHRFVLFNERDHWAIEKVSPPFAFRETRAIEFAAGLALRGMRLVASFGVRDAEAWMVQMALPDVMAIMESPR